MDKMARAVWSVVILFANLMFCFVCIISITSGTEIPSKKTNIDPNEGSRDNPSNIHIQKLKEEDNDNEEKKMYTQNSNLRRVRRSFGRLRRVFNSIFRRQKKVIPAANISPIPTDGTPFPTDGPPFPTDGSPLPTDRPPLPADCLPIKTVIPAPGLSKVPKPDFLKQSACPGNILTRANNEQRF